MTGSKPPGRARADTSGRSIGRFTPDTRGVTVQIGAILLLAVLVLSLSSIQAFVVPEDNKRVEFTHSQEIRNDFVDFRNGALRAGTSGTTVPVSLSLGTTYPTRLLTINPPPARGQIRTTNVTGSASTIVVGNATALNNETSDYWNENRTFETRSLVYTPAYNEYQNPPETRYENTVVVNSFDDANVTVTGQQLVNDRSITLVTLVGNLSANGVDNRVVDLRSVSPGQTTVRTVAIENRSTGPLTLSVPTRLSTATWQDLLEAERTDGQVTSVTAGGPGRVNVSLESGVYDVRIVRVRVGDGSQSPPARYLTTVDGSTDRSVLFGTTETVAVEARDRYNNPVSGVTVDVTDPGLGQFVSARQAVTDESGRAYFRYRAPSTTGTASFNATIGEGVARNVTYELTVDAGGGGGRSLVWSTPFDWDPGDAALERGVVHEGYGDHQADRVDLGSGNDSDGLVAYWSLDDDGGSTATDNTGNGNDGSLQNGVIVQADGTLGTSAFRFDGQNDYVRIPSTDRLSGGADATITASAWFALDGPLSDLSGSTSLVAKEESSTNGDWGLVLYGNCPPWATCSPTDNEEAYIGYYGEAGGSDYGLLYGLPTASGWHHGTIVLDNLNDTLEVYYDGELVIEETALPAQVSSNTTRFVEIGGTVYQNSYLDGRIDEARVYDRPLSASEVSVLYNGSSPRGTPQAWRGSINTSYKLFETQVSPTSLSLTDVDATVPMGTSMTVTVQSDPDSDGVYEEESGAISLSSGTNTYGVSGLTQASGRYRLHVVGTTTDITAGPTLEEVRLTSS